MAEVRTTCRPNTPSAIHKPPPSHIRNQQSSIANRHPQCAPEPDRIPQAKSGKSVPQSREIGVYEHVGSAPCESGRSVRQRVGLRSVRGPLPNHNSSTIASVKVDRTHPPHQSGGASSPSICSGLTGVLALRSPIALPHCDRTRNRRKWHAPVGATHGGPFFVVRCGIATNSISNAPGSRPSTIAANGSEILPLIVRCRPSCSPSARGRAGISLQCWDCRGV